MNDWFLPAPAPGSADGWCFDIAGAETLAIYHDYLSYFKRLNELIITTGEGDEVNIIGYDFNVDIDPDPVTQKPKTVDKYLYELNLQLFEFYAFLQQAFSRKVELRIMPSAGVDNGPLFNGTIGQIFDKKHGQIDKQLHGNSHHHQKAIYMRIKKKHHLFIGGMDISTHEGRETWFDIQAEITGPAAQLGLITMKERLASVFGGNFAPRELKAGIANNNSLPFNCQFLRTYPPTLGKIDRRYAADGDFTYCNLLTRAIVKATKSIYIEDQFVFPMGTNPHLIEDPVMFKNRSYLAKGPNNLDTLLLNAVKQRNVKLVVLASPYSTVDFRPNDRKNILNYFSAQVKPTQRLSFKFISPNNFVHTKTWIIDDELIVIGSANYWNESLVYAGSIINRPGASIMPESEFGVAITSSANGALFGFPDLPLARALRLKLWQDIRVKFDIGFKFQTTAGSSFEEEYTEWTKPDARGNQPLSQTQFYE